MTKGTMTLSWEFLPTIYLGPIYLKRDGYCCSEGFIGYQMGLPHQHQRKPTRQDKYHS